MDRYEIEKLIHRVLTTKDEEIDCEQLGKLIARYVDLEVSGADAPVLLPKVYQHLKQCDACGELHEVLYEIAVLEEQSALPDTDVLLDDIVVGGSGVSAWQPADTARPSRSSAVRPAARRAVPSRKDGSVDSGERRDTDRGGLTGMVGWLRWGWLAAAAALIVVAVVGVWGWQQATIASDVQRQSAFIAAADRAVRMQGTEQDPDARGYLFVQEEAERGLLVIDGLNPVPPNKVYQMWVTFNGTKVSAGTFVLGSTEKGQVWVSFSDSPIRFASLEITLEPEGGSEKPTSSPVCVWGGAS